LFLSNPIKRKKIVLEKKSRYRTAEQKNNHLLSTIHIIYINNAEVRISYQSRNPRFMQYIWIINTQKVFLIILLIYQVESNDIHL
jgi:hypothetical protein